MRCLYNAKKPLTFKPKRQLLMFANSHGVNSGLLLKNCFCSGVEKPSDPKAVENESGENEYRRVSQTELDAMLKSDPIMDKRYKILQLEIDVLKHAGKLVPDDVKPFHWVELLKLETRSARRKYLQFLFTIEKKRENVKKKKEMARIERNESELPEIDKSEYGLHKTSMFMRIYDTTMNHFYHSRLIQAMMFGQRLIIDCGYYSKMTPRESTECAKQLAYLFAENRLHPDPFDLHFCNVNKSSLLMQRFHRIIPTAYDADFPLNIMEGSYMEKFKKDELVYLTPHCNNEMKNYDPDSVYIIGAIVDKTNSEPLSLATAKKEGIRMAKLPLDKYLLWGSGSGKRLPLNQMVNILTDIRITGDWHKALQHVPQRKLEKSFDRFQQNFVPKQRPERRFDFPFEQSKQKNRNSFSFQSRQNKTTFSSN